jgi:hypothetical protein
MYYPRRHIPHSATLDPYRMVQHVAVTGTVLKSSIKQYGFKGCAFTMVMKVSDQQFFKGCAFTMVMKVSDQQVF